MEIVNFDSDVVLWLGRSLAVLGPVGGGEGEGGVRERKGKGVGKGGKGREREGKGGKGYLLCEMFP